MMIDGAFNVNSTSVEAWKAVLSSLRATADDHVFQRNRGGKPVTYFTRVTASAIWPMRP